MKREKEAFKARSIVHADWSTSAAKRWMAKAVLQENGQYLAYLPECVGEPETLLQRLRRAAAPEDAILLGFDFPIGLPARYAQKCGIDDFQSLLPSLGTGKWADFYRVCECPEHIHLLRPFYPLRAGNARHVHLIRALGMKAIDELRRQCELPHPGRRAAAPLFWTLGGQQVGKAAICGWRDVLGPSLRGDQLDCQDASCKLAIWPFAGRLNELLQPGMTVVVETYPAEYYAHLGLAFSPARRLYQSEHKGPRAGKRSPDGRAANASTLLAWAEKSGVALAQELTHGSVKTWTGNKKCGKLTA
jgi:hypothetical protein